MNRLFLGIETIPCSEEQKALFIEVRRSRNGNAEKDEVEQLQLKTVKCCAKRKIE